MPNEMKDELLAMLQAWLEKRGQPDSGLRYEQGSHSNNVGIRHSLSSVQLHGSDADFVAKHFHGEGARNMAAALALRPQREDAGAGGGVVLPDDNDGIEQDAFEEWAEAERFDMERHPMHWLFLDPATNGARRGWRAGLMHARTRFLAAPQPSAPEGLREALGYAAMGLGRIHDALTDTSPKQAVGEMVAHFRDRALTALSAASPPTGRDATEEGWPRTLDEWIEDDGDVVWWALDENGEWRGEAAWIGTPLDLGRGYAVSIGDHDFVVNLGGWPGYHTHWTRHPDIPPLPAAPKPETAQ